MVIRKGGRQVSEKTAAATSGLVASGVTPGTVPGSVVRGDGRQIGGKTFRESQAGHPVDSDYRMTLPYLSQGEVGRQSTLGPPTSYVNQPRVDFNPGSLSSIYGGKAGGPDYASIGGGIQTPQLSYLNGVGKKGLSPGEVINLQRDSDNQLARENAARQTSALNIVGANIGSTRSLYDSMYKADKNFGAQEYARINEDYANKTAHNQDMLISRGLGNSGLVGTINHLADREANDAFMGVNANRVDRQIGITQGLAQADTAGANNLANIYMQNRLQDTGAQSATGFATPKVDNSFISKNGDSLAGTGAGAGAAGLLALFGL